MIVPVVSNTPLSPAKRKRKRKREKNDTWACNKRNRSVVCWLLKPAQNMLRRGISTYRWKGK